MNKQKSWSYAEITDVLEQEIGRLMRRVAEAPDKDQALVLRSMASGVYFAWSRLMVNRKNGEDDTRMRALAELD